MTRRFVPGALVLLAIACASATRVEPVRDRWVELRAQYETIESIRAAHPIPESDRRKQVEALVARERRLETLYPTFIASLRSYVEETGDPRASSLYARERMRLADEYARYLARYDKAIEIYRHALEITPDDRNLLERIESAESRLFLSAETFMRIQPGMDEEEVVDLVGYPRVDWVRETMRNGRNYAVWIYPKEDGGAAAIYFDEGIVYHKNWTAAPADSSGS